MVPEIQSKTDRIICHFGSFFAPLPPPRPAPFPNYPENQNFEKKIKENAWKYYPFIYACVP